MVERIPNPTPGRMRVFYAVGLPDEVHSHVGKAQHALKEAHAESELLERPRWTVPAQHHVTLKFVGALRRDCLMTLKEVLREASARSRLSLAVSNLGAFGSPARARVLHAEVEDPSGELTAFACDLEAAVEERFGVPRETRKYRPHVTLARFRSGADVRGLLEAVPFEPLPFEATKVRLYESVFLKERGSTRGRYTVLDEVTLA